MRGCRLVGDLITLTILASFVLVGLYFSIKNANEKYDVGVYIPNLSNSQMVLTYLSGDAIREPGTPQSSAYHWITEFDELLNAETHFVQRYALAVLYYSAKGENWTHSDNFLDDNHECEWYGISCNSKLEVDEIVLDNNNLNGTIPAEISGIKTLTRFNVNNNKLHGVIPPEFGTIESLVHFQVRGNRLHGKMPSEIFIPSGMETIDIAQNRLWGSLPESIGSLTNLTRLQISENKMTGTVPLNITKCQKLGKLLY